MIIAWVIGRGGLLGASLERALVGEGTSVFVPRHAFDWSDETALIGEMRSAVDAFCAAVGAADAWEIYWAAGIGTMGSQEAALVTETQALEALLDALSQSPLVAVRGRLALASSAGAIYAGCNDDVIDERSSECPTTAYARVKLLNEGLAKAYSSRSRVPVLLGRISTLYGVGRARGKQQGLLTHISQCLIQNRPVHIFVPLDTIRDYIAADDAAALIIRSLRSIGEPIGVVKIVASERPATISEIVSLFKRVARRPPRIVTSGAPTSGVYTRRIQFRSIVPPSRDREPLSLLIGISQVLAAERRRYEAGDRWVA